MKGSKLLQTADQERVKKKYSKYLSVNEGSELLQIIDKERLKRSTPSICP